MGPHQHPLDIVIDAFESEFISNLNLTPVDVPHEFSPLTGQAGKMKLEMQTRRFTGPRIEVATLGAVRDENHRCVALNAWTVPRHPLAVPLFVLDAVMFRQGLSLAVLDLYPIDDLYWKQQASPSLAQCQQQLGDALTARVLPDEMAGALSPASIFGSIDSGSEACFAQQAARLIHTVAQMLTSPPDALPTSVRWDQSLERWKTAMRKSRKESRGLTAIFGPIAQRYLNEFLFVF